MVESDSGEVKKLISCLYIGTIPVKSPDDIKEINAKMDSLYNNIPHQARKPVNIGISPTAIQVVSPKSRILSCRVRYITFFCVHEQDNRLCAVVQRNVLGKFMCHLFMCDPDATFLCSNLEAACEVFMFRCCYRCYQLRYQMLLDAEHVGDLGTS